MRPIFDTVPRPQMHFVPIKNELQLDLQALHRARDRLVTQRTGLINQIRAFLLERGVTVRQGRLALAKALPELLEADRELSPMMRALLGRLRAQWRRWTSKSPPSIGRSSAAPERIRAPGC